jgi:hypothetical protein
MTHELHPKIQPGTFWRTRDGGVREITFRDDPLICFREHYLDGSMFAATRGPNASIWDKCTQVADAAGTPLEPETPELISLPIDRRGGLAHVCPCGTHYAAFIDTRVIVKDVAYRIVGFRADDKAMLDSYTTHLVPIWYSGIESVIYATHAVLKKETDQ